MPSEHPKLRSDLVTSEVKKAGEPFFIVKDPVTRRFFRFGEHEHFILGSLTGTSSPDEIREAYERRFGAALPAESLARFLGRVEALCLIDRGLTGGQIAKLQRKASTESRWSSRLLQMRLRAVDPDRLLGAVAPRTRFLFTWQFVALVGALTVVATALTAYRWEDYTAQARTLFRPESIPAFVLVVLVVTALHELAHGLTCKHYGGEVREIGFLLIYLVPALYCNVSDAWLFKEKGKRIWVSAAGTFFQVFLYAIAAIVWFVVDRGTRLSEACAITIAIAGLTALFNFNPLIKLDGYYMLSDYLEIPNLRKRAFAYLWRVARRTAGQMGIGRGAVAGARVGDVAGAAGAGAGGAARGGAMGASVAGAAAGAAPGETSRERVIYLTYGISAGVYSLGLLAFVILQVGGLVVSAFRAP